MSRAPCCEKIGLKRGPWTSEEDKILVDYIKQNGHGCWRALPKQAGLLRCGKSCRLRWMNYLRPDIKRGQFQAEEERSILQLHAILGNRWSIIASQLPGRTDNEIKNFWNTHLKKKLVRRGFYPSTHAPNSEVGNNQPRAALRHASQWEIVRLEAEARFSRNSRLSRSNSILSYKNEANCKAPTDLYLKLWNSEAGKAFRKESASNNSNSDDTINHTNAFPWTNTTHPQLALSPVASFPGSAFSFNSDELMSDLPNGIPREEDNSLAVGQTRNKKPINSSDDGVHNNHDMWDFADLLLDSPNASTADTNSQPQSHWADEEIMITGTAYMEIYGEKSTLEAD